MSLTAKCHAFRGHLPTPVPRRRVAAARTTACDHNARVTFRRVVRRIPILGRILERRWIPDSDDRARHQAVVAARLPAPAADLPGDTAEPAETHHT